MTIGEKIKYYRTRLKMTQGSLAELSDIHPVSIRKYETNKMQPQPAQIERIAAALGVSYTALIGIDNAGLRLETVGDLMGVLMVLLGANVLQIAGEHNEDGTLEYDKAKIKFNPILMPFIEILCPAGNGEKKISLKDAILNVKDTQIFEDLVRWEKVNRNYQSMAAKYKDDKSEAIQAALSEMLETKEKIELELQRSNVLLDMSNGIKVKVNPDYEMSE
jgi:transcriptional regulator with XRE-family HTH domain